MKLDWSLYCQAKKEAEFDLKEVDVSLKEVGFWSKYLGGHVKFPKNLLHLMVGLLEVIIKLVC